MIARIFVNEQKRAVIDRNYCIVFNILAGISLLSTIIGDRTKKALGGPGEDYGPCVLVS